MTERIIVGNSPEQQPYQYCKALEDGHLLYFPSIPFFFPQEEIDFLLQQKQKKGKNRKNIAYKPQSDRMTGHDAADLKSAKRLQEILREFSGRASRYLAGLLSLYAKKWQVDYTSFRPFQEKGRSLRLRARNDLLHVDAFPTRPLHGNRILRFFTNINPTMSRNWVTSDGFRTLVEKYGGTRVMFPRSEGHSLYERLGRKMKQILRSSGVPLPLRSPYDVFMLKMHNFLKENLDFQKNCHKDYWEFPPNCCWAVFTDQVSHAALSGQYALEQTFLVPVSALLYPERSPLGILERLCGKSMLCDNRPK